MRSAGRSGRAQQPAAAAGMPCAMLLRCERSAVRRHTAAAHQRTPPRGQPSAERCVRAERGLCLRQRHAACLTAPPTRRTPAPSTRGRRRETGGVPGRCYARRCTSHSLTAAPHGSGGDSLSSLLKGGSGCHDGGAGCAQYSRGVASSLERGQWEHRTCQRRQNSRTKRARERPMPIRASAPLVLYLRSFDDRPLCPARYSLACVSSVEELSLCVC